MSEIRNDTGSEVEQLEDAFAAGHIEVNDERLKTSISKPGSAVQSPRILERGDCFRIYRLQVKLPNYDYANVEVAIIPGFSVLDLKAYLVEQMVKRGYAGVNVDRMRLIHKDEELLDLDELMDVGLDKESLIKIELILRMIPDIYLSKILQDKRHLTPIRKKHTDSELEDERQEDNDSEHRTREEELKLEELILQQQKKQSQDSEFGKAVFDSAFYEFHEFVRNTYPVHNQTDVPIDAKIKLIIGANHSGGTLALSAMVASDEWDAQMESVIPTPPPQSVDQTPSSPRRENSSSPQGSLHSSPHISPHGSPYGSRSGSPSSMTRGFSPGRNGSEKCLKEQLSLQFNQAKAGDMLGYFNNDLDQARSRGFHKWTSTRGGGGKLLLIEAGDAAALERQKKYHKAQDKAAKKKLGKLYRKPPIKSVGGLTHAKEEEDSDKSSALEACRYSWRGVNDGYVNGDNFSWQRYTQELPVPAVVETKRDFSVTGHQEDLSRYTESFLKSIFNISPSSSNLDLQDESSKSKSKNSITLTLPPMEDLDAVNIPDPSSGKWHSHNNVESGLVPSHSAISGTILDDLVAVSEVFLLPNEPLKYDTEYLLVLCNGVPVLPLADVQSSFLGYSTAGHVCEDMIIRFRTVPAPAKKKSRKSSKTPSKADAAEMKQSAQVIEEKEEKIIDLAAINWDELKTWEKK